MELVPQRDATTLIPIIQRNILPGSTVWNDEWAAYNDYNQLNALVWIRPLVFIQTTRKHAGLLAKPVLSGATALPVSIYAPMLNEFENQTVAYRTFRYGSRQIAKKTRSLGLLRMTRYLVHGSGKSAAACH